MPESLRELFITQHRHGKEARYAKYRELLEQAHTAGRDAALEAVPFADRRIGSVWVQLDDGRSSFARFIRQGNVAGWRHGGRQIGLYLPAPAEFGNVGKATAWAMAFRAVLAGGDVAVTVGMRVVTVPGES